MDATKSAYAVCKFLITVTDVGVKVHLLRAKASVDPLKSMSIHRLELVRYCRGVRLAYSVQTALNLPNILITYWSDSMVAVALWWIRQCGNWAIVVANRVKEINQLILSSHWGHLSGNFNLSYLLFRGCTPQQSCKLQWCEGPPGLKKNSVKIGLLMSCRVYQKYKKKDSTM